MLQIAVRVVATQWLFAVLVLPVAVAQGAPIQSELHEKIKKSKATQVNPAVIHAARNVADHPALPPAAEIPAPPSIAPDAAAPVATPATDPSGTTAEADATVVTAPGLVRGQVFHVQLQQSGELAMRSILRAKIDKLAPATAETLQTVDGVYRQLTLDNREVQIKPFALVGQVLRYVPEKRQFVGNVAVGAIDISGTVGTTDLSVPILFEVLDSGQQVTLARTSPPFERFEVATQASGQPVTLSIASNFSREGMSVTVPVEPTVLVETDTTELRGLGLQVARVTVRAVGPVAVPSGSSASLTAPGAFLSDNAPKFDANGVARTELRSDRSGTIIVGAAATGFVSGQADPIQVHWPRQTLAFTLAGGLIGGFVRLGGKIHGRTNRIRFVIALSLSVLTGMLVFVLYVLGVKLLPVKFGVEVGDLFAFAAAALGGWIGSGVLPGLKSSGAR